MLIAVDVCMLGMTPTMRSFVEWIAEVMKRVYKEHVVCEDAVTFLRARVPMKVECSLEIRAL